MRSVDSTIGRMQERGAAALTAGSYMERPIYGSALGSLGQAFLGQATSGPTEGGMAEHSISAKNWNSCNETGSENNYPYILINRVAKDGKQYIDSGKYQRDKNFHLGRVTAGEEKQSMSMKLAKTDLFYFWVGVSVLALGGLLLGFELYELVLLADI